MRVYWCGKEVGRTSTASLEIHGQPRWQKGTETFLLPLPHVVSPDKSDSIKSPNPMINARVEDSELRIEVWTPEATNVDGRLYGLVRLEGSDLFRQCNKENDKRPKRAVQYRLSSCKPSKPAMRLLSSPETDRESLSEMASLEMVTFLLSPQDGETALKKTTPLKLAQNVVRADFHAHLRMELSRIFTNNEQSISKDRYKEALRLLEISNQSNGDIAIYFLTREGVSLLGNLLSEQSTPLDRKTAVAIAQSVHRDSQC